MTQQPSRDPNAAMFLDHAEIADVGPAIVANHRAMPREIVVDLQQTDLATIQHRRVGGAEHMQPSPHREAGDRRFPRHIDLVECDDELQLGATILVGEAGLTGEYREMRPSVVDAVDQRRRQRHVEDRDSRLPTIEPSNRVSHQVTAGVEVRRPTHEPTDTCRIAQRRTDARLAAVPVQVHCGDEPVVLDRDPMSRARSPTGRRCTHQGHAPSGSATSRPAPSSRGSPPSREH